MLLPKEIWKDIEGYEGKYQVSNLGQVRSLNYQRTKGKVKILKPATSSGYKYVYLCNNDKPKPYAVHRLVAEAFIPNPNNYKEVNHIDENKTNNMVENLEWCTHKYNSNYGTKLQRQSKAMKGRKQSGEEKAKRSESRKGYKHSEQTLDKMSMSNPNKKAVLCIELNKPFSSITKAQKWLGKGDIRNALKTGHKAGGYHWQYLD